MPKNNNRDNWQNWYLIERYPIKRLPHRHAQLLNIPQVNNWNGQGQIEFDVVGKRILQLPGIYSCSIGHWQNNILRDEEIFFSTAVISKDEIRVRIRTVFFTTFGLVIINTLLGAFGWSLEDVCRLILNLISK